MTVEEKLQEVMDWSGTQQKEVARLTGISTSTLSGYIRGKRKMTVEAAQKIASALNLSVWVLLNGNPLPVTPLDITEAEGQILAQYRTLTDSERDAVDTVIRTFNERKT